MTHRRGGEGWDSNLGRLGSVGHTFQHQVLQTKPLGSPVSPSLPPEPRRPRPPPAHPQLLRVLVGPADAVFPAAAARARAGGAHWPPLRAAEPAESLAVLRAQRARLGPWRRPRFGLRPRARRGHCQAPGAARSTCRRCGGAWSEWAWSLWPRPPRSTAHPDPGRLTGLLP